MLFLHNEIDGSVLQAYGEGCSWSAMSLKFKDFRDVE